MRLKKSKRSAIILSGIIVISFALTSAILNLVIPFLVTGDIHVLVANPESLSQSANLLGLVLFIVFVLAVLTGIGAFWLYRFFGERYYGVRSAIRWAIFGFIFALLIKAPDWVISQDLWLLKGLAQLCGLFAAFFLARWLIPMQRS